MSRRDAIVRRRHALVVLGFAVAVRLVVWLDVRDAPFWRVQLEDETAYLDLARLLLAHSPPPHGAWYVSPGYAYALAGLSAAGCSTLAIKALQLAVGAFSAWLVFRLACRLCAARTACIAACVWALTPIALLQEVLLLKTTFATASVLAAIACTMPPVGRRARWGLAGAAMGAAILLRAELLVVAIALAGAAVVARRRGWAEPPSRRALATFLAVPGIAMAIPLAQSYRWSRDVVPFAFGGGVNFYIGNHAGADGSYVPLRPDRFDPAQEEADAVLLTSRALGRPARPSDVSRHFVALGLEYWRRSPLGAVALTLRKVALACGPWEIADTLSTRQAGRWVRLLRNGWIGAGLFLPLGLVGWFVSRREPRVWPLQVGVAASLAAIVPFFLFERFRLHFIALAVPFAAAAVERGGYALRAGAWRSVLAGAATALAFGIGTGFVRVARDENVLRVNIGEMFFQQGRYDEARREFDAVRAGSPDAWRVGIDIANTEAARGRTGEALAALDDVLRRLHAEADRTGTPSMEELRYCHELAGDLECERGGAERAVRHYEAALSFAPPEATAALRAKIDACKPK